MQFTATAPQPLFSCKATQAENQQTNRILTAQYTFKTLPPSIILPLFTVHAAHLCTKPWSALSPWWCEKVYRDAFDVAQLFWPTKGLYCILFFLLSSLISIAFINTMLYNTVFTYFKFTQCLWLCNYLNLNTRRLFNRHKQNTIYGQNMWIPDFHTHMCLLNFIPDLAPLFAVKMTFIFPGRLSMSIWSMAVGIGPFNHKKISEVR